MAEQSENEASKSGQPVEAPEGGKQAPEARTDENANVIYGPDSQVGATGGESATGYQESTDHIPDPTAMGGTLETSGTGGGVNERISGTTRIFGDVERAVAKVEAVVQEHLADIVDEVRGVLKREEAGAQTQALPQQTVENGGVPEHGGNIVAPNNDTGAAQDAPRSPNVAGDAGGVDAGTTQVADGAQGESYGQQTIAGASNPQDEAEAAKAGEERREGDSTDGESAEGDKAAATKAPAKKAAAKKTASSSDAKSDDAKK